MNYAFHKDEAEIATRILLAAMQNEKFSCTAENVANFYKTIILTSLIKFAWPSSVLGLTSRRRRKKTPAFRPVQSHSFQ